MRAEVCQYLLHPTALGHVEGTASVAVTAADAVPGALFQRQIVFPGQSIALQARSVVQPYSPEV